MPGATAKGVPYAIGSDAAAQLNEIIQLLAEWIDARPGVSPLTTAQRNALAGADLWDGRIIWNKTLAIFERYNTGTNSWVSASPDLTNINAATLDGIDSTGFLLVGGKAADSELLDGMDSTVFATAAALAATNAAVAGKLGVGAKAADSELLDGLDSTVFALAARTSQRTIGFAEMWLHGGGS